MSKKILIACILVMTMIFSFATMSYAAGTPTITIGNVSGSAGDEVPVEIIMSNNPGIVLLEFYINFDKTAMSFTGWDDGDSVLGDGGTTKKFTTANKNGKIKIVLGDDTFEEDITDDGNVITVTFELLKDIAPTDTQPTLKYSYATNFEGAIAGDEIVFAVANETVESGETAWLGHTEYANGKYLAIAKFAAGKTQYGINFDNYDFVAEGANADNIFAIEIQDLDAAPTGVTAFAR